MAVGAKNPRHAKNNLKGQKNVHFTEIQRIESDIFLCKKNVNKHF